MDRCTLVVWLTDCWWCCCCCHFACNSSCIMQCRIHVMVYGLLTCLTRLVIVQCQMCSCLYWNQKTAHCWSDSLFACVSAKLCPAELCFSLIISIFYCSWFSAWFDLCCVSRILDHTTLQHKYRVACISVNDFECKINALLSSQNYKLATTIKVVSLKFCSKNLNDVCYLLIL